jgi:drug/metabolite transporter (DMT)-like permease
MTQTIPPHTTGHPSAIYPLIAQLTGWCAAIALACYTPITSRILVEPPATPHGATIAWYVTVAAASALALAAMRDQWHRYSPRGLFRRDMYCSSRGPGDGL